MKIHLVFLMLISAVSCKHTPSGKDESFGKGAISQSPPGGTLIKRDLREINCDGFSEAVWYRMSRPVAAVIWHEYIGVRITSIDANKKQRHEFETSGLSDPSDLANFTSWWATPGSSNKVAHMIEAKRYKNCSDFVASASRVNNAMASSLYQNVGIRILAMVVTPLPVLGGRPCANEAENATTTWLSSPQKVESCEDCTEVIPKAQWSKTSVDWTPDAFPGAESLKNK